ncbi:MAG: alpha/beta fold hydrolase [Burkholderiaceae bacterium]
MTTRQIKSGAAMLAVEVTGNGDPIVFLHAGVCDMRMWSTQLNSLSVNYKSIAYDRRGFGKTSYEAESFSAVEDLMEVLRATTDGEPAVLVGCSQGGRVAIDAVLTYPSTIRALVLIAPSVAGAPEPAHTLEIELLLKRLKEAEELGDLSQVNAIEAHMWLDGPLAQERRIGGQARELFMNMNRIALCALPTGANRDAVPAFQRLCEITVPSLVIQGNLDFPHIRERSQKIARTILNGSYIELVGAAHLPSLERPADVTRLLSEFLSNDRLGKA